MAFPVPPNDPNTPIPNNPFYYPLQNNLQSDFGPLIIGTGLNLDNATGILSANDPGTPAGVTALLAGDGIFLDNNVGIVTVTNAGVTNIVAGTGISVSKVGGTYTITNLGTSGGTGTVTQINSGAGLTGGPITGVGTLALTQTGVAAATYSNPTITVDEYGRITYAAPGTLAGYPVQAQYPLQSDGLLPSTISIAAASTSARGSVQLNDTVTSTSTLEAATANAVRNTHLKACTGCVIAVKANQKAIIACTNAANALSAASNAELEAGTALACANVAQNTANGAVIDAASAQSTADSALTLAVTANNTANTANNSANVRIPCSSFALSGDILVATGAGTFVNLGVGADGQVLTACSNCTSGVYWECLSTIGLGTVTQINTGTGLVGGPITSVGVIALDTTGVVAGCYINPTIEVNAEGQIVSATGGGTVVSGITASAPLTATGSPVVDLAVAYASSTTSGVVCLHNSLTSTSPLLALTAQQGKCLQDQLTAVCADKISSIAAASPLNVTAGINPSISIDTASTTQLGATQLYDGTDSTSTALALTANQGKNLQDQINAIPANVSIPCSTLLAKGSLVTATAPGTPVNLSPGPDGEVLTACSSCTEGLIWAPIPVDRGSYLNLARLTNATALAGLGATDPIPFEQAITQFNLDWDVADPGTVCILTTGTYQFNVNISYCWDAAAPAQVCAYVLTSCNLSNVTGGAYTVVSETGGNAGYGALSCSSMLRLFSGDTLEFGFGMNHTGCFYSPVGGESRATLTIHRIAH